MMQYEGYKQEENETPVFYGTQRRRAPYHFHYEDWTGEEVYKSLFPERISLKKFAAQMAVFLVLLIIVRVSVNFM